jgi:hypothetical protein
MKKEGMTLRAESVAATVTGTVGTALFTTLLVKGIVGPASYVTLLSLAALISLVLHGFSRLRQPDLKNLKLTLSKIEEAKAEVFAKEKDLKNIALRLARILAFNNAFQNRVPSEESLSLQRQWYRTQTHQLLELLNIKAFERSDVLKYQEALDKLDTLVGQPQEREKHYAKLIRIVMEDLEAHQLQSSK